MTNSWKHFNVGRDLEHLLQRDGRVVAIAPNSFGIRVGGQEWPAFEISAFFRETILASDFAWPQVQARPSGRVKVIGVSGGPDYTKITTDGVVFAEGVVRDWHRWIQDCGCAKAANLPWPRIEAVLVDQVAPD